MFRLKKKKKNTEIFRSIGTGIILSLDNTPDPVFSQRLMGDGYAMQPSNGYIYAPLSGRVTTVFPTGHAYGIATDNGFEVLIHLGIDTVELQGEGFISIVKQDDVIKQGDTLAIMDIDSIKRHKKETLCLVIFTSGQKIEALKENTHVNQYSENFFRFVE